MRSRPGLWPWAFSNGHLARAWEFKTNAPAFANPQQHGSRIKGAAPGRLWRRHIKVLAFGELWAKRFK